MARRKTGRPRIEDRAKTNEARKPWLRLEMSRRTWYRRQAEKRNAMLAKQRACDQLGGGR